MILVDTSVWVEHLRRSGHLMADLLTRGRVLAHPFVIGEIALGGASDEVIENLRNLPAADVATDVETLDFIRRRRLAGRGIGYVDAHVLASLHLTPNASLWTHDKSLRTVADELGLSARLPT